ncbi:TM2 domain-containing protein [Arthrobacter sp. L77]|uniref:TM2 domain-containing protein n=1 Tax=Arthrobacter sp. L77 TaxID=1496689 RepID=UPI00068CE5C2|nr:TM2 domain-containing protein [Arthrobacter sp. L77]
MSTSASGPDHEESGEHGTASGAADAARPGRPIGGNRPSPEPYAPGDDAPGDTAGDPYGDQPHQQGPHQQPPYQQDPYQQGPYQQPSPYQQRPPYPQSGPGQTPYAQTPYGQSGYNQGAYSQGPYNPNPYGQPYAPQKSRVIAGVLGILLGSLGIHRFYLGFTTIGIIQLLMSTVGAALTFGLSAIAAGIWGLIEGIMILVGSEQFRRDARGIPLKD